MQEELLHFIWRYRLYGSGTMQTDFGVPVEVIHPGTYNTNAGADFSDARIRIGEVLMAGNVEIHVNAADWHTHRHNEDAAYNNVVLHVVYESNDKVTKLQNGQLVPVLQLKEYVSPQLLNRYELLRQEGSTIPCANMIARVPEDFSIPSYMDRLVIDRLQSKIAVVEAMLKDSVNDWDQVAFQMIGMYYGASVNKEPFALLARSLPLSVIHKHQIDPTQVEALLFGQAGMLDVDYDDDYPKQLKREYTYLRKLHNLTPIEPHSWKFFRIRPVSFPTIKIAQLAALLMKQRHLFSAILDCRSIAELRQFFEVTVNPYWQTHFQFDKPVDKTNALLGSMITDVLLINAVVPLLFSYGRYKGDEAICERALELLSKLPTENNAIIRMWNSIGIKALTANDSQALIQLKSQYCDHKRCLQCQIGHKLLR